jgi:hypothetical protein
MVPVVGERCTFHTGAGALAASTRNTRVPTSWVARYSSAMRCLRSPALQKITGTPFAAPHALTRRANRPAIRIRCVLSSSASQSSCQRRHRPGYWPRLGDKLVVAGGQNEKQLVPQTEVFEALECRGVLVGGCRLRAAATAPRSRWLARASRAAAVEFRTCQARLGRSRASDELANASNKVYALRGGSWVELPSLTHARAAAAAAVVPSADASIASKPPENPDGAVGLSCRRRLAGNPRTQAGWRPPSDY